MSPERFSLRTLPNRGFSSPISSTSQHSSTPFPTDETHCCSLRYSNSSHIIRTPSDQGYYPIVRVCMCVCVCVCVVAKLCLILQDPVDCSPPASSVHGILQTGILEWAAIAFSGASFPPRNHIYIFIICVTLFFFFSLTLYI